MVLTDLIWSQVPEIEVFSIDTGRLYPETYDLIERLQHRYGKALHIYYPEAEPLEDWVGSNGINGFRDSLEKRQGCCAIRKVEPFRRAIAGHQAWVTGIRRGQSASRALASPVEWDQQYGLHKVSPLLDWSEEEIWEYIRKKRLPYNTLHDSGFPSIGCAPCTRAVQPRRGRALRPVVVGTRRFARMRFASAPRRRILAVKYFPMFFDVARQSVLVVGGGEVALRKVDLLLRAGAVRQCGGARCPARIA